MSAPMEILDLLFYCVQQLGIMLGVGGEIVVLAVYLLDIRDANVSAKEEHFARSVKRVVNIGLACIVVSGLGITLVHLSELQGSTVYEPAYLFKWSLIGVLLLISYLNRSISLSSGLIEGLTGGTWLALLLVHVLAPVTSWSFLGVLYAIWMAGFVVCWTFALFILGGAKVFTTPDDGEAQPLPPKHMPIRAPEPTLYSPLPPMQSNNLMPLETAEPPKEYEYVPPPQNVVHAPTMHAPADLSYTLISVEAFPYKTLAVDRPTILHPHLTEEPPAPVMLPAPDPERTSIVSIKHSDVTEHLPAVRIMPQKPEDLETQHKGPIIKFG